MRIFPKDIYLNGEHVAHEPSIFQIARRKGHFIPHLIISTILIHLLGIIFLISFIYR